MIKDHSSSFDLPTQMLILLRIRAGIKRGEGLGLELWAPSMFHSSMREKELSDVSLSIQ